MKIKIVDCYQSGRGWSFRAVDTDTGRSTPTMNNESTSGPAAKRPTDAEIIAQAEKLFTAEDTAIRPTEPVSLDIKSVSDAILIEEVKKRPQITAKALGLSVELVEKVKP